MPVCASGRAGQYLLASSSGRVLARSGSRVLLSSSLPACTFRGFNEHSGGPIRQFSATLRQPLFGTARLSSPPNQMRGTWWRCWKAQPLNNWCLDKCGVNLSSGILWAKLRAWSVEARWISVRLIVFLSFFWGKLLECSARKQNGLSGDRRGVSWHWNKSSFDVIGI